MTYRALCERLARAGIESAEWDASLLIAHCFGKEPSLIPLDPDREYASNGLESLVARREAREPLQYLLGEWSFYRQTYEVSPDCLIPRSDTEILVEEAIRTLPRHARFADLCTGSGCIAVSVLAERPDTTACAVDKFPRTLALAERNALRNGVRDRFSPLLADLLTDDAAFGADTRFDAILSNPPYIPTHVLDSLSAEVHAEPAAALDGGADGLLFYRVLLAKYARLLTRDGFFLLEIGFDQGADVLRLGREHGFPCGRVLRDLGGNDRVVLLRRA